MAAKISLGPITWEDRNQNCKIEFFMDQTEVRATLGMKNRTYQILEKNITVECYSTRFSEKLSLTITSMSTLDPAAKEDILNSLSLRQIKVTFFDDTYVSSKNVTLICLKLSELRSHSLMIRMYVLIFWPCRVHKFPTRLLKPLIAGSCCPKSKIRWQSGVKFTKAKCKSNSAFHEIG